VVGKPNRPSTPITDARRCRNSAIRRPDTSKTNSPSSSRSCSSTATSSSPSLTTRRAIPTGQPRLTDPQSRRGQRGSDRDRGRRRVNHRHGCNGDRRREHRRRYQLSDTYCCGGILDPQFARHGRGSPPRESRSGTGPLARSTPSSNGGRVRGHADHRARQQAGGWNLVVLPAGFRRGRPMAEPNSWSPIPAGGAPTDREKSRR